MLKVIQLDSTVFCVAYLSIYITLTANINLRDIYELHTFSFWWGCCKKKSDEKSIKHKFKLLYNTPCLLPRPPLLQDISRVPGTSRRRRLRARRMRSTHVCVVQILRATSLVICHVVIIFVETHGQVVRHCARGCVPRVVARQGQVGMHTRDAVEVAVVEKE